MMIVQPWYIDSNVHNSLQQTQQKTSSYTLIEGGHGDYEKVVMLYQKSPVAGYQVGRVEVVNNQALTRQFEGKVMVLNARGDNPAFAPKWKNENELSIRTRIDQALTNITVQHPSTYQHVRLVPAFHGTKAGLLDSIFKTGFANLATTDSGFFGKGIYNSSDAEYAHRVYSDGTILFNWVAFFSAYPVTMPDMSKLQGGSNYSNYDAHYTLVVPQNPQNPNEIVYLPITKMQQPFTYDELVVFDSSHVLPRYLITLTPDGVNLKPVGPVATGLTLMMAIGTFLPQADPNLQPLLKQQLSALILSLDTALTQDQLSVLRIIERSQTGLEEPVKIALADRITKLLDTNTDKVVHSQNPVVKPQSSTLPNTSTNIISSSKPVIMPQKIVSSLPSLAFGKADWEKYFGDVGVEPPLPSNINEILERPCPVWSGKKIKETHLLVLIPETVNGRTYTLDYLGELIQKPRGEGYATKYSNYWDILKKEYGGKSAGTSHWVLMTNDVLEESRGKSYTDQQKLVTKYAGYGIPKTLQAATCILMEHVKSRKRWYSDSPYTYTRCKDQTIGYQNLVGGFTSAEFSVHYSGYEHMHIGVGLLWKF